MKKKPWYKIDAKAGDSGEKRIEVLIYDHIGGWFGTSAAQLIKDFKAQDDGKCPVTLAINSPGGDVFDGFALNAWASRLGDRCTARIDGLAASAASVVAMGAHKIVMNSSAMMMIHNPLTYASGHADDLRKAADVLDKAGAALKATYQRRPAIAVDDASLTQMLNDTTWMSAQEAVEKGFADSIEQQTEPVKARWSGHVLAMYDKAPPALLAAEGAEDDAPPQPVPPADNAVPPAAVLAANAARLAAACATAKIPDAIEALLKQAPLADDAAITAEIGRLQAIGDLCVAARMPAMAKEFAMAGLSADACRARLFDQMVKNAAHEIDNKEPPAGDAPHETFAQTPDMRAIYAARKAR